MFRSMKTYFVYFLVKPDGTPFYVGKSSYENPRKRYHRLYVHQYQARHGNHTRKCIVIRKVERAGLNISMRIVFETSYEQEAFMMERKLIATTEDLVNHTDGGEGQSGFRFSKESKRQMSLVRMGRQIHNAESRLKISFAQRGERGNGAKLSKKNAFSILEMRREGATFQAIADRYGISLQAAANLIHGKSWPYLDRPYFNDIKINGRWRSGHVKIPLEQRPGIIAEFKQRNVTMTQLAAKYDVSVATISLIINLKRRMI